MLKGRNCNMFLHKNRQKSHRETGFHCSALQHAGRCHVVMQSLYLPYFPVFLVFLQYFSHFLTFLVFQQSQRSLETLFTETQGENIFYYYKSYIYKSWYLGIRRSGTIKPGRLTGPHQKAVQFLPLYSNWRTMGYRTQSAHVLRTNGARAGTWVYRVDQRGHVMSRMNYDVLFVLSRLWLVRLFVRSIQILNRVIQIILSYLETWNFRVNNCSWSSTSGRLEVWKSFCFFPPKTILTLEWEGKLSRLLSGEISLFNVCKIQKIQASWYIVCIPFAVVSTEKLNRQPGEKSRKLSAKRQFREKTASV